jgi:hypothetical protein
VRPTVGTFLLVSQLYMISVGHSTASLQLSGASDHSEAASRTSKGKYDQVGVLKGGRSGALVALPVMGA